MSPAPENHNGPNGDLTTLNTLPDPRTPSPNRAKSRNASPSPGQAPDLTAEVAALSSKLVDAINHQTNLDDALQNARHELESARSRLAHLEAAAIEHDRQVSEGELVRKDILEAMEKKMQAELDEQTRKRTAAEGTKKALELEVENLTASLFEEANGMVVTARQEREAAEKRNEQMQTKLTETETLLASHQEQLRNLKNVMQEIRSERSWAESATAPSTPITGRDSGSYVRAAADTFSPSKAPYPPAQTNPENPLHYTHLIQPIMRMDIQAFDEFISLIRTNKHTGSSSRVTSGSGLNVGNLGSKDGSQQSIIVSSQSATSSSSQPTPPGSFVPSPSVDQSPTTSNSALKDTKFYKRSLSEDIEPTLRLDTAPGLSWLARRSVISAMLAGSLIVDPYPTTYKYYHASFACSLCGETRQDETHIRRHRFRTSDSEDTQRYPVCDYCLNRLRSSCDFVTFMRLALRGHWRNDSIDECKTAWEECIRLRERMFWSRIGAGVVPVGAGTAPAIETRTSMVLADPRDKVRGSISRESTSSLSRAVTAESTLPAASDTGTVSAEADTQKSEISEPEAAKSQNSSNPAMITTAPSTPSKSRPLSMPPSRTSFTPLPNRTSSPSPTQVARENLNSSSRSSMSDMPQANGVTSRSPLRRDTSPTKSAVAEFEKRYSMPSPGSSSASVIPSIRNSSPGPTSSGAGGSSPKKNSLVAALASKFQDNAGNSAGANEGGAAAGGSRPKSFNGSPERL